MGPFDHMPPQFLVAIIGSVTWGIVAMVLGVAFFRYRLRKSEDQGATPRLTADVTGRLARIEAAVESIAIEVERISESQRFLAKLQSERTPIESGGTSPDRQR
jgi:hypothetical protein